MKNKNGFTLVELLAVIVVLAIIIAIAVPAFGKISNSINEKQYKNKLELIKAAALKYADDTNYVAFYIKDLIEAGYLDPDKGNDIFDNNNNSINCYPITISEDTGIRYAEIEEKNHTSSGVCDINYLASANKYFNIKYTTSENLDNEQSVTWTALTNESWFSAGKVTLKLFANSGYTLETPTWYVGAIASSGASQQTLSINVKDSINNEEYKVKVKVKDNSNNEKNIEMKFYIQIDHVNPYLKNQEKFESLNKSYSKVKKYKPQGADAHSGYYGSYLVKIGSISSNSGNVIYNSDITCSNVDISQYKNDEKQITSNGVYRLCLRDNAGNINDGGNVDINNKPLENSNVIGIDTVDTYPPVCVQPDKVYCKSGNKRYVCAGTGIETVWVSDASSVKAIIPCTDQKQYKIGDAENNPTGPGSGCVKNEYEVPLTNNGNGTYKASTKMADKVGNTTASDCTINNIRINVDDQAPYFNVSIPTNDGTTYKKSNSAVITLKDDASGLKAGTYKFKYAWGTSEVACSKMTSETSIIVPTDGTKQATSKQIEIKDQTGNGKLYVCNSTAIYDNTGYNSINQTRKAVSMYLDNTGPNISFSKNGNTAWSKSQSTTVTVTDSYSNPVKNLKYAWSTSNTTRPSFNKTFTNTITNDSTTEAFSGAYYLWIYAEDSLNNSNIVVSKVFNFDNTAPNNLKITATKWKDNDDSSTKEKGGKYTFDKWSDKKIYLKFSATDNRTNAVITYNYQQVGFDDNKNGTSSSQNITSNGTTAIRFKACDEAGNCSNYSQIYKVKIDRKKPDNSEWIIKETKTDTWKLRIHCDDYPNGNAKFENSATVVQSKINEYTNYINSSPELSDFRSVTFEYESGIHGVATANGMGTLESGKDYREFDLNWSSKQNSKKYSIECVDNTGNRRTYEKTVKHGCLKEDNFVVVNNVYHPKTCTCRSVGTKAVSTAYTAIGESCPAGTNYEPPGIGALYDCTVPTVSSYPCDCGDYTQESYSYSQCIKKGYYLAE